MGELSVSGSLDVLKHSVDVDAVFGGNFRRFHGGDADDVLDLVLDLQRTGGRQVDLVHHGDDLQPGVNGKVGVGNFPIFFSLDPYPLVYFSESFPN